MRFLFDIFDFNEINSISLIDLEFMLIQCANSTFMLFQIKGEIDQQDVTDFLTLYFTEDTRINISQMLKWCMQVPEITLFMKTIGQKGPDYKDIFSPDLKKLDVVIPPVSSVGKRNSTPPSPPPLRREYRVGRCD